MLGHNLFSTFTDYEIKQQFMKIYNEDNIVNYQVLDAENIPESINWI